MQRKTRGILLEAQDDHVSEMCLSLREDQNPPGLQRRELCQQTKEGDPSPPMSPGKSYLKSQVQFWAPLYKRNRHTGVSLPEGQEDD